MFINVDLEKENAELKAKSIIPYQEKGYVFDEDLHEIYFPANGELMIKASVVEELKEQIIDIKEDVERERNKQRRLENSFTTNILNNLLHKWKSAE